MARELGLDKVGATREALAPVLDYRNGSFGKIKSNYEVRYKEEGLTKLSSGEWTDDDIRRILRRTVLANYVGHKTLHDVGWHYSSDDVRKLVLANGINFVSSGSILDGAIVRFESPIPGLHPPTQRTFSTSIVRNDVFILFGIEEKLIRAFRELLALLKSPEKIKVSELEGKLKSFGEALNAFDDFDEGENSIFAAVDGLIQKCVPAAEARSSSLTFTSVKDGAERTKVFTPRASPQSARAAGQK